MLLDCDKVISITDKGDQVGVYELGTDGSEVLFECEPEIARKIVKLWNDHHEEADDDNDLNRPFSITSVCRADLEDKGYNISKVDNDTMKRLAEKMADAYTGNDTFWIDLEIIANDLEIPKK